MVSAARSASWFGSSAVALIVLVAQPGWAQGVFKCQKDGTTSYQPTPCANGKSNAVSIAPGPSEKELEEARLRAQDTKAKAAVVQIPAESSSSRQAQQPLRGLNQDCTSLASARADAFGRRNGALHSTRTTASYAQQGSNDQAVVRAQGDIAAIENRMRTSGCNP